VSQFAVHRNRNAASRGRFPLLLDVQTDLLDGLGTRVVIPMEPATAASRRTAMAALNPFVAVEGKTYILVTTQLAGIPTGELGPPIADLSSERDSIIAALDLLFTGI
jgi:toxin CcdB